MSEIVYEKYNDVVVLRVIGGVTFEEITEAMKRHFPNVTKHLIWDYTNGDLSHVTAEDFRKVPDMAAKYFTNRQKGRTTFACPNDLTYGMLRMYTAFADLDNMPYEYEVHRNFEDALKWVESF